MRPVPVVLGCVLVARDEHGLLVWGDAGLAEFPLYAAGIPLAYLPGQRALPDADLHSGRKDILIRVTRAPTGAALPFSRRDPAR